MFMAGWQTRERCGGLKRSLVHFLLRARGLDSLDNILRVFFDGILFVRYHLPQNMVDTISKLFRFRKLLKL